MKTLEQWLAEYSESHRDPRNKRLHWLCVPPIVLTVIGFLRLVPAGDDTINAATVSAALAMLYYAALSWRLALGTVAPFAVMYALVQWSYHGLGAAGHGTLMVAIFVLAWIGQFIGHHLEGRKPSFFKDVQFLLIGPLWLLADLYRRWRLPVYGGVVAN